MSITLIESGEKKLNVILFFRATSGVNAEGSDIPNHGLVRDGTPCGDNLVCINQTCVSIFPHIDQTKCPTNQINVECSGHGVSSLLCIM